MTKKIWLALIVSLIVWTPAARAQKSLPASIRDRYLVMPEKPAEHNLAGMPFTPWTADHWFKGNLHCHSNTNGERMLRHGDGPPELTLKWYADHGYDFVVLTDHNVMHPPLNAPPGLLYIPGEEVTTVGREGYHVNGLGITTYIRPNFDADKIDAYQYAADAIVAQGGVAQLNHPITPLAYIYPEDLLALHNIALFEVYNMQPGSYRALGEPLWDNVLTRGAVYWGTMTDDAHIFRTAHPGIVYPPGGGFVMVDAPELTRDAILAALRAGRFYSSSGVLIKRYAVTAEAVSVEVAGDAPCEIKFIGARGTVLQSGRGPAASYRPKGDELYVRARVEDENGKIALLQPVFFR